MHRRPLAGIAQVCDAVTLRIETREPYDASGEFLRAVRTVVSEDCAAWMRAFAPVNIPDRLYDSFVCVSSAVSRIERFDGVPYGPETRERVTMDSEFPCLLNGGDTLTSFRVDIAVVE